MKKVPLTQAGAEKLRSELHRLKTVDRPATIAAIAEARSHGDLSENAEYDAARERQGFLEGRISRIEAKLAQAHIVNPAEVDAGGRRIHRWRRPRAPLSRTVPRAGNQRLSCMRLRTPTRSGAVYYLCSGP